MLDQRWDESQYCRRDDGWHLVTRTVFHSFFHQSDEREFACTSQSLELPAELTMGARFTPSCTSENGASSEDITGEIVGFETLVVADEPVGHGARSVRDDERGQVHGHDSVERWYARDVPLLIVREVHSGDRTSPSALGPVRYEEQYELMLQGIDPLS